MKSNMAVAFLEKEGETIHDYDGMCGELVDGMMHWLGEDQVSILYIKPRDESGIIDHGSASLDPWSYHMVAVVDGHVHDAWFPDLVLPPDEYVGEAFPNQLLTAEITS